jgi:PEP-CTERM motif
MTARTFTISFLVASFSLLFMSMPLRADIINFGPVPNGGSLSGGFVYDATTNTFPSWNISVTAGDGFSAITYSDTIAGDTAGPGGFNGAGFYDFSFFSPTGGNGTPPFNGRTLSLVVPGVSDSSISGLPAPGQTSQITLVTNDSPLAAAASCFAIQPPGAIPCSVEGQALGGRALLQPAFLNVTDPPAATDVIYTATFTNIPGGGTPPVPEPSTVLLLASGFGVLFVLKPRSA